MGGAEGGRRGGGGEAGRLGSVASSGDLGPEYELRLGDGCGGSSSGVVRRTRRRAGCGGQRGETTNEPSTPAPPAVLASGVCGGASRRNCRHYHSVRRSSGALRCHRLPQLRRASDVIAVSHVRGLDAAPALLALMPGCIALLYGYVLDSDDSDGYATARRQMGGGAGGGGGGGSGGSGGGPSTIPHHLCCHLLRCQRLSKPSASVAASWAATPSPLSPDAQQASHGYRRIRTARLRRRRGDTTSCSRGRSSCSCTTARPSCLPSAVGR